MAVITHNLSGIEKALEEHRYRREIIILEEGHYWRNTLTSHSRGGYLVPGPAVVEIEAYGDGGLNVTVHKGKVKPLPQEDGEYKLLYQEGELLVHSPDNPHLRHLDIYPGPRMVTVKILDGEVEKIEISSDVPEHVGA